MRYQIRAVGRDGITRLTLDAASPEDARQQTRRQGCTPLKVRRDHLLQFPKRRFPVALFAQELVTLLNAGLGVVEAIEALAERHHEDLFRPVLADVLAKLRDGRALSSAFEAAPANFPRLFVETVRASERTGDLAEGLLRYGEHDRQVDVLRNRIISASIYPALLIALGTMVALFLLGYVVPRFAAIYSDVGRDTPLASRLLFEFGRFVGTHAWFFASSLLAGAALLTAGVAAPRSRQVLGATLRRLPLIRDRLRLYALSRFYRTAGMLVRGGIPLPRALDMAGSLLPSSLQEGLARALREIREGQSLSGSLATHALTTPIAFRMLRVGERSGEMGSMLERIASFYDEDLTRWLERFLRLFEPLLMIVIGTAIGLIVVLLYMPIFELAGGLQ